TDTPLAPAPPTAAAELETLTAFLDYYRSVMVRKVEGVDPDGLRFTLVPSGTCL
ncbi:MAG: mini-circle protein, partial [Gemmatimonadetes bacterium]|nr:mini-circle protein [Actinomycetota bacterium]NIT90027.1 mini-circle protein [Gemmatimonadota bacterium]NIS34937.1 mini-circle protein [Actinomycetota bacterium]NIU33834.1 mini-circle protein [Gemmatimonadota bacterium]NIU69681.1 mini-circle protein [Actinomycetota bacterium]